MSALRVKSVAIYALLSLVFVSCSPGGASSDKIVRVSRQNNSGTYVYFREAVLGKSREYKLGSIDQSGSKDVVSLVSKTPLAIGYSGMAYATPEVKMLKISRKKGEPGVEPTVANAQDGSYPIARPLIIYTSGEPTGPIKAYIDWIMSEEGQKIVAEIGYVPVKATGSSAGSDEAAAIRVTGSDTMVNLSQAWAENYSKKHPNVSVQVAGGGSGVGIAGLIDGTVQMANASRSMKPIELAKAKQKNGVAPKEFIVGKDALAVYVHKDRPIDEISIEELAEIYGDGGTIENWSQLGQTGSVQAAAGN